MVTVRGIIDFRPTRSLGSVLWLVAAVAVPTSARLLLAPWLHDKVIYALYYPAVMLLTLRLGGWWGCGALLGSACAANFFLLSRSMRLTLGTPDEFVGLLVYLFAGAMVVVTASQLREAVRRLEAARDREFTLNAELQHRVKNSLAVVQGLAYQSFKSKTDPEVYQQFLARLIALGQAHDLLVRGEWRCCELPELAEAALCPFMDLGLRVEGPDCAMPAQACVPLVLALHELATNAVKYGALSTAAGHVSLRWRLLSDSQAGMIELRWIEVGGPVVTPPNRRGLGSRLLTPQPGLEKVKLDYAPAGVSCEILVCRHAVEVPARQEARATSLTLADQPRPA